MGNEILAVDEECRRAEVIEALDDIATRCSDYHKHKETISWAGLGVLFAYSTAFSTLILEVESQAIMGVSLVVNLLIFCWFSAFVVGQIRIKNEEQQAMNASISLKMKVIAGKVEHSTLDLAIASDSYLPSCVLSEMGSRPKVIQKGTLLLAIIMLVMLFLVTSSICLFRLFDI